MIIAECCTNWHDLNEAREMIRIAHENGAGLVKFQLFDAEDDRGTPHYDWVKSHELTFDQVKELFDYGASIGQEVFFSVFKAVFVSGCELIGVKRYKIAAGDFADKKNTYLRIRRTNKPLIISIPLLNHRIHKSKLVRWAWSKTKISLLWCPSGYPSGIEGFKAIKFEEDYSQGFSDHSIGIDAAKIILARGAQIVEKHFVLAHDPQYPDDAWSMTPSELKELVRWEKVCREALG